MKRRIIIAAVALVLLAAAFAAGRYTRQARVETRVEYRNVVEYRDRVVERVVKGPVRVRTVTREVPGPAGPERVVERVVERGPVTTDRTTEGQAMVQVEQRASTTTDAGPRWMVGIALGPQLSLTPRFVYGAELHYRLVGPVWAGVSVTSTREAHLSLALTF